MPANRSLVPAVAVALFLAVAVADARAQAPARPPRLAPALRADGLVGTTRAAHAGVGVGLRLGTYAYVDVAAGAGVGGRADTGDAGDGAGGARASGRLEVMGRFALDPFEQFRRGPYAAAGLVVRVDEGMRRRVHLTAVVGVEGRPASRWRPALEAGFGGGVRLGVVVRRSGVPDR